MRETLKGFLDQIRIRTLKISRTIVFFGITFCKPVFKVKTFYKYVCSFVLGIFVKT